MQVAESRRDKLKVFISYSRHNLAFVDRLQAALRSRNIDASADRTEIEKSEEWWKRIQQLITEADTIVFVLSPGSVASEVCRQEVNFADGLRKRFVPVVAENITDLKVPEALARLNYIFFTQNDSVGASGHFDDAMNQLTHALETDIEWIREHTRLGTLAQRWLAQDQGSDLLLRGRELSTAERWINKRPHKGPAPSDAHQAFLNASRNAVTTRKRWWIGGSLTIIIAFGAFGLAIWALYAILGAIRQ
jgi:hypothetical protein